MTMKPAQTWFHFVLVLLMILLLNLPRGAWGTMNKPFNNPLNIQKQNRDKIDAALQEATRKIDKKRKRKKTVSLMKSKPAKKRDRVYRDGNSFSQHGKGSYKEY